jgi:hypothetical protein
LSHTIKVNDGAKYTVSLLYTSSGDGTISFDVHGRDATGPLKIYSTFDVRDTVPWRQWHHWNKSDSVGTIIQERGVHVLTLHIVANGNMNLDYMDLKKDLK